MAFDSVKAALGEAVLRQGLNYLAGDPEENLVKFARWVFSIAREPSHKEMARDFLAMFSDPDNIWRRYAIRLLRQLAPEVRNKVVINFLINANALGIPHIRENSKKYGVNIPWTILFDPTGRCNLHCKGCWAGEYDRTLDMDYATLDRICTEAEDLGIHFFVLSGGEPTVRLNDLLALANKHNDAVFHAFTNGTLLANPEVAGKLREVGNITFAISVDGLEKSTDARRGKGVFTKVMAAMDTLCQAGIAYGFSTTYTRENTEEIASDAFIDLMAEKGCAMGWFFTYVPVGGAESDLDFMATPEQRALMVQAVEHWRKTKPIPVADFWNDGHLVGGCIAGGRNYFHINAHGDVEPCAFVHYANVNIKDTSLVEALRSPIFQAYQKRQPFNGNSLRPCPIIDNPEALEAIVAESGAHSTEKSGISAAALCRPLAGYAQAWGAVAQALGSRS